MGLVLIAAVALLPSGGGAQVRIPLCRSLTVVGSVSEPAGDYEPIVRVDSVTTRAVELTYSNQVATPSGLIHNISRRTVLQDDLARARAVAPWFGAGVARTIPGMTAIGPSRAVLRALRAGDTVTLGILSKRGSTLPAGRGVHPNVYEAVASYPLRRVERESVGIPVTVNGEPVTLPSIHAAGTYYDERADFYFLDDVDNPLSLRTRITSSAGAPPLSSQTVKITFRCGDTPVTRLERALLETGRAEVYDLYFDFNSDRIRQESDSTLRDIARILERHPDWQLAIEGHTDSIASDRFNLELSQRRAAAVKTALTGRFAIAAGRLTTAGYGESRPRDRNDTPEGRARNRRVELVRLPSPSRDPH